MALASVLAASSAVSAIPAPTPPAVRVVRGAAVDSGRIGELAASLDYDLGRIFRFVADEIRYEPYVGILRGAQGTLDAAAGNSVDQALLLASLLDESLIEYRFARGTLDADTAARLADSVSKDRSSASAAAELAFQGGPFPGALEIPSVLPESDSPDALESARDRASAEDAFEASGGLVEESVTLITSALAGSGSDLGDMAAGSVSAASVLPEDEIRGHTWVQVTPGADPSQSDWLDLDPVFGGQSIGETITQVDQSMDELPDDLRHVIRFEVSVERIHEDELVTSTALEFSGYADELAQEAILFLHLPPSALAQLGVAIGRSLGVAQLAYHPALAFPSRVIIADEPMVFALGGNDQDVFAASGYGEGEASAEWLSVTVRSPGAQTVTTTRTIFDRVPKEARARGELSIGDVQPIEEVEIAPGAGPDYPPMVGGKGFAISTGPTSAIGLLRRTSSPSTSALAVLARAYLGLRDAMAAEYGIAEGVQAFVDRPGVVSFGLDVGVSDDGPTATPGVDIWHRSLAAVTTRDASVTLQEARIRAGVTEHIAERVAVEIGEDVPHGLPRSAGVSTVFEAAQAAGIPTLVLSGSLPPGLPFDPMATALIDEMLMAGETVIVPAEPVLLLGRERIGWWGVDPRTGRTFDMMDNGSGADFAEMYIVEKITSCAAAASAFLIFPAMATVFEGIYAKIFGLTASAMGVLMALYSKQAAWLLPFCLKA